MSERKQKLLGALVIIGALVIGWFAGAALG